MASIFFRGGAPAVSQVNAWTFAGTWIIGETITFTIGSKAYTYTITSATIATFLPLLEAALEALSSAVYPEHQEQTWTSTATTIVGTADTAGKPFTCTVSTDSASGTINGGASSTGTETTASAGPYDVSTAANWSGGAVPTGACSAPVQSAASASSGGSLANGTTYYWVITALNANGETVVSNERSLAIADPNNTADLSWAAVTNATGYKVYRSTTTGTYGATSLRATLGVVLTYQDNGDATGAGQPPGSSTAVGDTVTIDMEGARLRYGLAQSGIVLAQRRIIARDVEIGLPRINSDATDYPEYRTLNWQLTATLDYVNTESSRIQLDHGTGQTTYEQDASGVGDDNVPAVLLNGSHASNAWNIFGGQAGLGYYAGDSARANVLRLDKGATVILGAGCVCDTLNNYGGNLTVNTAIATALNHPGTAGGTTTIDGSGAVAQITMQSGTCYYNTTGALGGNTVLGINAALTFDEDQRTKTVTNPILVYSPGVRVLDSFGVVSGGLTLQYINCVGSLTLKPNSQVVVSYL